ncbi:MAG: SBBP repeat-containing protein [Candidatus Syntrophosphaera sp.]
MKALKDFLVIAVLLCGAAVIHPQTQQWQWAIGAGGPGNDEGRAIATDSQGNLYVTGSFSGTASFGPHILTSEGEEDIYAAKLDPEGNFLWAVSAGGPSWGEAGHGIAVDGAGNVWLAGDFRETASFGPHSLTSAGYGDVFAAKLDPEGNFLWAVSAGGSSHDSCYDLAVDASGNAWLTGCFRYGASFGPHTLDSAGNRDIFAAKLDPGGNFLWAVNAGGTDQDYAYGIAIDGAGNAFLTGYFPGTASFGDHELTSAGSTDIFAATLDPEGNFIWAVRAGGPSGDSGHDIAVDEAGNAWLTGYFYGTADFGSHSLASAGYDDIFTARLDPDGNFLWAAGAGGADWDTGDGLAVDASGYAWLTGHFSGTAGFGPHFLTSCGGDDAFCAKLDPDGSFLWAYGAGGPSNDSGQGLVIDNAGHAWLAGSFKSTASFGPHDITSNGEYDACVARLGPSTPVEEELASGAGYSRLLAAYPNPFHKDQNAILKAEVASGDSGILIICNLRGQVVREMALKPGTHRISIKGEGLAPGLYLCGLKTRSCRSVKKILLLE